MMTDAELVQRICDAQKALSVAILNAKRAGLHVGMEVKTEGTDNGVASWFDFKRGGTRIPLPRSEDAVRVVDCLAPGESVCIPLPLFPR